jgi:rhamnose transport system permease protein
MTTRERFRQLCLRHEAVLIVLLVALLAVAADKVPGFLRPESQLLLSRQLWETAILALGMTVIIISGGIDLSAGAAMGVSAVALGWVFNASGSLILACCCCLLTGTACGTLNGTLISRFRVHPLVVTLATSAVFRGIAEGVSQGQAYSRFGDQFSSIARGTLLGLPLPGWLFILLALCFAVFLGMTAAGRQIYAAGHNETASRYSGIDTERQKRFLYTASGLLAGVAAMIYVARFDTAKADVGRGMELDVIAAVVIGGTSIFGGRGTIFGTTLGLLLIHETKIFTGRYWKNDELRSVAVGCLLIAALLVYQLFSRSRKSVRGV